MQRNGRKGFVVKMLPYIVVILLVAAIIGYVFLVEFSGMSTLGDWVLGAGSGLLSATSGALDAIPGVGDIGNLFGGNDDGENATSCQGTDVQITSVSTEVISGNNIDIQFTVENQGSESACAVVRVGGRESGRLTQWFPDLGLGGKVNWKSLEAGGTWNDGWSSEGEVNDATNWNNGFYVELWSGGDTEDQGTLLESDPDHFVYVSPDDIGSTIEPESAPETCPSSCSVRLWDEDGAAGNSRIVYEGVRSFEGDLNTAGVLPSANVFEVESFSDMADGCSFWVDHENSDGDPIGSDSASVTEFPSYAEQDAPSHWAYKVGVAPTEASCRSYGEPVLYVRYWSNQGAYRGCDGMTNGAIAIHANAANNRESSTAFRIRILDENGNEAAVYPGSSDWTTVESRETWYKTHKEDQSAYSDGFTVELYEQGNGKIEEASYTPNVC